MILHASMYQSNFKEEGQYEKHENIQSQKECDGLFESSYLL